MESYFIPPYLPRREDTRLTIAQQKQVLVESNKRACYGHPSLQNDLGIWAASKFELPSPSSHSAVSKTIKKSEKIYRSTCTSAKNFRCPMCIFRDKALALRIADCAARGTTISKVIIQKGATRLGDSVNATFRPPERVSP